MRTFAALLVALAPLVAFLPAFGNEAVPTELDRVQQKRAVELSEHLRCLVCQNQTIADSNAELAQDLRRQVREQISQGRTDEQIVAFMVQRYGDFVLYNPPFKSTTILLWLGPGVLLLAGIVALIRNVGMRKRRIDPAGLSDEDRKRASELLGGNADKDLP